MGGAGHPAGLGSRLWHQPRSGRPATTTSMRRPSPAGTSRLRSRRATRLGLPPLCRCVLLLARGPALRASTPACAQAERWLPYSSKRPPQGQRFGASGRGRRSLRRSMTRYSASGTRVSALVVEGPTSWGVWLRVCDPATSGAACGRVRCGVLYHVAHLTCYFHGEEQITREMLLPLFDTWTHVSLEDCPQRQPGVEFPTPGAITRGRLHKVML